MPLRKIAGLAIGLVLGAALLTGPAHWTAPPPPPRGGATDYDSEGLAAGDYQRLGDYDGRVSAQELRAALVVVDPNDTVAPFLVTSSDEVALLADPGGAVLARVKLRRGPAARRVGTQTTGLPLRGLRILLDPGHFGGAWSEIEARHWVVGDRAPLREGNLNWGTALLVKAGLEAAGATVILSRAAPPTVPFPAIDLSGAALAAPASLLAWLWDHLGDSDLVDWLAARPDQLERFFDAARGARYADDETFYGVFSRFDLRRRGLLGAEVGADLSLSIHYNMAKNAAYNRVVVFVPGCVAGSEWQTPSSRYYALRRALEGDLTLLENLALAVSRNMQRRLGVPARQYPKRVDGQKLPIYPEDGVFARNLGFLRRARGPALLIEGPCMNNPAENARLLREDLEIDGRRYPQRVRQYAGAVTAAVIGGAAALGRH